jgi:hypothetical protein
VRQSLYWADGPGRSLDIGLKDRKWHNRKEHPDKSAVAEHNIDHGHRIQFNNSSILVMKTRYKVRIIRDAIEIELRPYKINREGGFCLNK